MAHHKRKRSRGKPSGHYSSKALEYRLKDKSKRTGTKITCRAWYKNYPCYWDVLMHNRPQRAATKVAERKIMLGDDPDGLIWPTGKKPHIYYW